MGVGGGGCLGYIITGHTLLCGKTTFHTHTNSPFWVLELDRGKGDLGGGRRGGVINSYSTRLDSGGLHIYIYIFYVICVI